MAKSKEEKAYRALVGINYISKETGEENRAEPGDKITGMSENAIKHEKAAGNIEEWEPRKTENVRGDDEGVEGVEVSGVTSRRNKGEIRVKEVGE